MPVYCDKAPEWASASVEKLLEPRKRNNPVPIGMNIVKYAWYWLYTKFINTESFIAESKQAVTERMGIKAAEELLEEVARAETHMHDSEIPQDALVNSTDQNANPKQKRCSRKDARL